MTIDIGVEIAIEISIDPEELAGGFEPKNEELAFSKAFAGTRHASYPVGPTLRCQEMPSGQKAVAAGSSSEAQDAGPGVGTIGPPRQQREDRVPHPAGA